MNKESLIKPNLLLVGFQRCGSSSLFDLLVSHSEIAGSNPKETFCFSDSSFEHFNSDMCYSQRPKEVLNRFFDINKPQDYSYILEGSVSNFYQQEALEFAVKNPEVKVIFILRNPIERIISVYKYFGMDGIHLPPRTNFSEYLKLIKKGNIDSELLKFGIAHGKYCKYIDLWEKAISKDRIHVTSLKAIKSEEKKIWSFLELSPPTAKIGKVNSSLKRQTKFPKLNLWLHNNLSGLGIGDTWMAKLYGKLSKTTSTVEISSEVIRELELQYIREYRNYGGLF